MVQLLKSEIDFDWGANPKQGKLFSEVMKADKGIGQNRNFGLFGGIRSGKTSAVLSIMFLLARKYDRSRWHIVRASYPQLLDTIQSFEKIYPEYKTKSIRKWSRSPSNYYVEFSNGSKIHFLSGKETHDKEHNFLLGMETNGLFLEQIEGISFDFWQKAISRVGSWYIDPMPPAFVFWTSNPTQTWVKEHLYQPWRKGKMQAGYWAEQINPKESPFVTQDQWNIWRQTYDPINFARFTEGDWDAVPTDKRWAYEFNEEIHLTTGLKIDFNLPIYISLDYNVDPMCATIHQHGPDWARTIEEITEPNSNIYEICRIIKTKYGKFKRNLKITGDASGHNRSSVARSDMSNHYAVIMNELQLTPHQIQINKRNPYHAQSQIECNSFLYHHPDYLIDREKCANLVKDLQMVEALPDGSINKKQDKRLTHSLDSWRYYINMFHSHWLNAK